MRLYLLVKYYTTIIKYNYNIKRKTNIGNRLGYIMII